MDQSAGALMGGLTGLLLVALVGLVIGAIAKLLMPGRDPGGWFITILLGIAGSWVGGFLARVLGLTTPAAGLALSVVGAMLLLWIYRMTRKA